MKTAHDAAIEGLRHLLSDQACIGVGHGSGLGFGSGRRQEILVDLATASDQRHDDVANDPVGELVGPLGNSLISDPKRLGRGADGAAEQFNGVGFAHAPLNHSYGASSTLVHRTGLLWGIMDKDHYSTRLADALQKRGNMHPQVLADQLGVSLQAVRKVLEGKSAALNVRNHFEACRFLNIDPEWLAIGDKQMTAPDSGTSERDHLADALETLTSALLKADKNARIALEPLLASMAKEPADSAKKSQLILRLLVTEGDSSQQSDDESRATKPTGVRIGDSAFRQLGGHDGRSDRDAGKRSAKR